jgi:hypothetical protein
MKRQAFRIISLLTLLLMAGSAIAQTVRVRGNIPFNFTVGNKTLPAGAYDVATIETHDTKMLRLQTLDGKSSMIVGSNAAVATKCPERSILVFNRYGSQYFLSEIWVKGETAGRHLPQSNREKELAKELASDLTQRRLEVVASMY